VNESVNCFLEKAQEALDDARILREAGRIAGPISRAYYAMFHAAEALLASLGLEFSSHHAVIAAFGREFAKTQLLDPKYHRYLRLSFDERQTADYDAQARLTEAEADLAVAAATEFLAAANDYLAPSEPSAEPGNNSHADT
jgi:uncharacterized protein (UPF0332 family)